MKVLQTNSVIVTTNYIFSEIVNSESLLNKFWQDVQNNSWPIFDSLMMTTINQSCPVAKQPSDLDLELAKLTGNLQQVQDTFLNHWTGDQLTKFLQDHLREHEALIQESKG